LRAGDGRIEAQVQDLGLKHSEIGLDECRAVFVLAPSVYTEVDREERFNLRADVRGPIMDPGFDPVGEVEIEAVLDPALLPFLAPMAGSSTEAVDYLIRSAALRPDDPIVDSDYWFALYVRQCVRLKESSEGEYLKVGYITDWAKEVGDAEAIGPLAQGVRDLLRENGWNFRETGPEVTELEFEGSQFGWTVTLRHIAKTGEVLIYSQLPFHVGTERLLAMAEAIARANWGIPNGCFELQWETGKIRFRTYSLFELGTFHPVVLGESLRANLVWADRYAPALRQVALLGKAPATAIAEIEGEGDPVVS
jgi:hypothetical protein